MAPPKRIRWRPGTADERVDYEITVGTKTTYQLNATVPMYVCMYGFRGTGNVVTPDSDAYRLKNMSTTNRASSASILDIVKVTHMAKIYDENHSDETLYSIAYDEETGSYTYCTATPHSPLPQAQCGLAGAGELSGHRR